MTQEYLVRHFDPTSRTVIETQARSASETALRHEWEGRGHVILEVRRPQLRPPVARQAFASSDIAWWCRELRTLVVAGMTVVEAIETLQSQSRGAARDTVHTTLLRGLREGLPLSKAMRMSGAFPEVLIASVTASERTSTLALALDDYLSYDELLQRLRRQVISAAIYPALVISLGVLISLFLLIFVIPRFSRMYTDFDGAVSMPTQLILATSRALRDRLPLVIAVLASFLLGAIWCWKRGYGTALAQYAISAIQPVNRQWDHFRRAKLYQSLTLLFKGGFTVDEALSVCGTLHLGTAFDQAISNARGQIAQGRLVSNAFADANLTDEVSRRLLAVGERTGSFGAVLQTIADRHAQAFLTFVERATRIVEPLLLLLVALVVGGIVVLMYMPIFDIANTVR